MDNLKQFFKSFLDTEEKLNDVSDGETLAKSKLDVISTGSLLLDNALGCWGIPRGRIVQFYGRPGSGKTLMSLLTIKEAQKLDSSSRQLFIDAEQTFNSKWAQQLGIDVKRVDVLKGATAVLGRDLFNALLGIPKEDAKTHAYKGKSKEGLLDKIAKKEININLIVLDSLGSLIPPGEDISEVGKSNMALMSRFLTPTLKKVALEVARANIPFIIINHVKDSMDAYGPDHTFSGGNSYHHALSARIYFESVMRKDAPILDSKDQKIGSTIRAAVEKSKFGPSRKTEFKVNYTSGILDPHEEIATLAVDKDIVLRPNNRTYTFKNKKWTSYADYIDGLKADPALCDEILKECVTKVSSDAAVPALDSSVEDDVLDLLTPAIEDDE